MPTEARTEHVNKMHEGLQAILRLMHSTTEAGGVQLLDMGLRAICVMHDEDDLSPVAAEALRADLVAVFQATHPRVSDRLGAELAKFTDVFAQLLEGPRADEERVQLARKALRELQLTGLATLQ
jgi:hypothetical protein